MAKTGPARPPWPITIDPPREDLSDAAGFAVQPDAAGAAVPATGLPGTATFPRTRLGALSASDEPLAILALPRGFSCWPLAIAFGHLARRQIARTGESGRGLATAGLVIGYLVLGLTVLTVVAVVVLLRATAPTGPGMTP